VIYSIAVAQLIDSGRLKPSQDIGALLDNRASGVLLGAVMTDHAIETATLGRIVEKGSGQKLDAYLTAQIFRPIGMNATRQEDPGFTTSFGDLERLALYLASGQIFAGATDAQGVNGRTLGLPSIQRNGWNGLQLDGSAAGYSIRLVAVPQAKLAYVLVIRGRADARGWSNFDDAIFDEFLPPDAASSQPLVTTQNRPGAPVKQGTYEPDPELRALVFLKSTGRDLNVRLDGDGRLVLSGAENANLVPGTTGIWSTPDGTLSANYRDGELFLSSGLAYRPVAFYKRPAIYALLALVIAVATVGAILFGSMPGPWTRFGRSIQERPDRSQQQERSA
jgi:CubicO group peptidase (beta-lactamase class C family)